MALAPGAFAGCDAAIVSADNARARFAAYVLLSAVAARAVPVAAWPAFAFAVVAIALLQTPVAARVWPRLTPGRTRAPAGEPAGDRMARP